jgi:hypothetical protein
MCRKDKTCDLPLVICRQLADDEYACQRSNSIRTVVTLLDPSMMMFPKADFHQFEFVQQEQSLAVVQFA